MAAEKPFIVVTALLDSGARPAALTRAHGDAMDRGIRAVGTHSVAGIDLVELSVGPKAFGALRRALKLSDETVALYDVFPLGDLTPDVRKVAGQFLAAEAVWALEEQDQLGGVTLDVRLDLPKGWERDPKAVHERLVAAGALQLTDDAIASFRAIKTAWDASA